MSSIPDDISAATKTAVPCYDGEGGCVHFDDDSCQDGCILFERVSKALLAERERAIHCCKVAMAPDREQFVMMGPAGIAMRIAAAIRGQL